MIYSIPTLAIRRHCGARYCIVPYMYGMENGWETKKEKLKKNRFLFFVMYRTVLRLINFYLKPIFCEISLYHFRPFSTTKWTFLCTVCLSLLRSGVMRCTKAAFHSARQWCVHGHQIPQKAPKWPILAIFTPKGAVETHQSEICHSPLLPGRYGPYRCVFSRAMNANKDCWGQHKQGDDEK